MKQPAALLVGAQRRLAPLVPPQAACGNGVQIDIFAVQPECSPALQTLLSMTFTCDNC